ncbi:MAG: glycoside hydrolase family 92 protein [Bacteroidales bacterium]|nr:glycoside hydrolase family 92 protein [Bacteroidales bacterium]
MKYFLVLMSVALFLISCNKKTEFKYICYVNPFIGTDGHGHTFPGATYPFGMVQLSPDTRLEGWDGCSGYHYSDSIIYGFSHTHLSGTGVSDYGDVLIMPTTGKVQVLPGTIEDGFDGYASPFSHQQEQASPGYYKVLLQKYQITAELTCTQRVGIHQYHFPPNQNQNVIIDLNHRDEVIESYIRFIGDDEIEGYRFSSAWATNQKVYFIIKFSKPFINKGIIINDHQFIQQSEIKGKNIRAFVNFSNRDTNLTCKVAISFVDMEGARKNLDQEASCWNFEKYKQKAQIAWENVLGKIEIDADSITKNIFYTAIYHCYTQPNIFNDVDKRYRGRDQKIHTLAKGNYYTVFSLWDTYRAWHPLMTILEPQTTNDFIQTFLLQYEQSKLLPIWELAANETNCMIGYHAVSVIYDAWQKGIRNFNAYQAIDAMKTMANRDIPSLKQYENNGCVLVSDDGESVSKTLEYAYDDWCIAQMAKSIHNTNIYNHYLQRSQYYKNLFDPVTKFFRARLNGSFIKPFSPYDVTFHYTEANAWQYACYVPHDISGLIELLGGNDSLEARLDSLFNTHSQISGRNQPDITGMIGQYAHGNEPSHHLAYLYNYIGKPFKSQQVLSKIYSFYTAQPDGLIGNEDCGQMSAWYVFSALGFYPVCPGDSIYVIGTPIINKALINLAKPFSIETHRTNKNDIYIQEVKLNGKPYHKSYISHQTILKGGKLDFYMGSKPSKWATTSEHCPKSVVDKNNFVPMPYYTEGVRAFKNKTTVTLSSIDSSQYRIYYTCDGSNPTEHSNLYIKPLILDSTCNIKAICVDKFHHYSHVCNFKVHKLDPLKTIKILSAYSSEYTGGGDIALIDGITGSTDFRTGEWQGYQDTDLVAIIDLGKVQTIQYLAAHFLQDVSPWILYPPYVEFSISMNGKQFKQVAIINNTHPRKDWKAQSTWFETTIKATQARYIKVFVKRSGNLPEWHPGKGFPAFFFIDEISIK